MDVLFARPDSHLKSAAIRPWLRWSVIGLWLMAAVSAFAGEPVQTADATGQPEQNSKSGYEDPDPMGGSSSVGRQLAEDDLVKDPLISFDFLHQDFYKLRSRVKKKYGIELNVDYNFVNQYASFSYSDRRAASGALRFYGRWTPPWVKEPAGGKLVFRFENRKRVGTDLSPKELGFETGSALSTAGFKEFGWGTTALYWAQSSPDERIAFVAGQMDPGDFEDIHPLLNPWTAFTNDASFNNPTTALPNQGLGIAVRTFVSDHFYLKGGLHDANGTPTKIDFKSFFDVQEYFTWVEVGWAPSPSLEAAGESVHFTLWHSDERVDAEVPEGWGVAFSASHEYGDKWIPYLRAGYSEGDAASLRAMLTVGAGLRVRTDDLLGAAITWGSPPRAEEGRDQYTIEGFYRLQLTQNVQVTPGFHWTLKPAYNPDHDSVGVAAVLRIRFVL